MHMESPSRAFCLYVSSKIRLYACHMQVQSQRSAAQPTAMTASVASTLSLTPSFEKIMRTPPDVFSNDSMAPMQYWPDLFRVYSWRRQVPESVLKV